MIALRAGKFTTEEVMWFFDKRTDPTAIALFNIAKKAGDAISAIEVARKYKLTLGVTGCDSLYLSVMGSNGINYGAKAPHLLAVLHAYYADAGVEGTVDDIARTVVEFDYNLLPHVAAAGAISPSLRKVYIERMLVENIAPGRDMYLAVVRLPKHEWVRASGETLLIDRVVEYALARGDIDDAYNLISLIPRLISPKDLRHKVAQALLAAQESVWSKDDRIAKAYKLA